MNDNEKLIEEAAKALTALTDAEWEIATAEGTEHLTGYFDAARRVLAVFEKAHAKQGEPSDAMVEAGAREAFFTDDAGGHIRGGFTWETIPEVGRENYRKMVRGVLHAALVAAGGVR